MTTKKLPILGLTMASVTRNVGKPINWTTSAGQSVSSYPPDSIDFVTTDGRRFRMDHDQDCCELVEIEDIAGDLSDLVGVPILQADEESREAGPDEVSETGTWTFYRLATIKGSVVIRWRGQSNGYYSERVDFCEVKS